jgi:outer membrane protein TolC
VQDKAKILSFLLLGVFDLDAQNFSAALSRMREQDPAWKKAAQIEAAAESQAFASNLVWTPSLAFSAAQEDSRNSFEKFSRARSTTFSSKWNLWKSGGDWASWQKDHALLDAARAKSQAAQLKLLRDYATLLFDFEKERQTLELSIAQNKVQQRNLQIFRRKYQNGQVAKLEVDKLELDSMVSEDRELESRRRLEDLKTLLQARLAGDYLAKDWPWKREILALKRPPASEESPALENSAELKTLQYSEEAAGASRREALALFGPSIDLTAAYGRDYNGWKSVGTENRWMWGLSFSWLFWNSGRDYAAYRRALWQERDLERDVALAQRSAHERWANLWRSFVRARESAEQRQELEKRSEDVLLRSQKLFESGRLDVNALGLDQNRWLDSRLRLVEAWSKAHISLLEICTSWSLELCPADLRL